MVSKAQRFGWLAMVSAVLAWALCPVPLPAQGRESIEPRGGVEEQARTDVILSPLSEPATADAMIEQMSEAAGVIFAGQVLAVRRPSEIGGPGEGATESVVEVDFRVDEAVRGTASGTVYTLREWAGLWNGSAGNRYRTGQRLLVFLYSPDAHGLSSPVGGRDGAVPIRGGGVAPGPDDTTSSAAEWMVDLRWVQAQVLRRNALLVMPGRRPVSRRPIGFLTGETIGRDEVESALARRQPVRLAVEAPVPVEAQPLSLVLAMCTQAVRRVDVAR